MIIKVRPILNRITRELVWISFRKRGDYERIHNNARRFISHYKQMTGDQSTRKIFVQFRDPLKEILKNMCTKTGSNLLFSLLILFLSRGGGLWWTHFPSKCCTGRSLLDSETNRDISGNQYLSVVVGYNRCLR